MLRTCRTTWFWDQSRSGGCFSNDCSHLCTKLVYCKNMIQTRVDVLTRG